MTDHEKRIEELEYRVLELQQAIRAITNALTWDAAFPLELSRIIDDLYAQGK